MNACNIFNRFHTHSESVAYSSTNIEPRYKKQLCLCTVYNGTIYAKREKEIICVFNKCINSGIVRMLDIVTSHYLFYNWLEQMGRMFAHTAHRKTYATATSLHDSDVSLICFTYIWQYRPHLQVRTMNDISVKNFAKGFSSRWENTHFSDYTLTRMRLIRVIDLRISMFKYSG